LQKRKQAIKRLTNRVFCLTERRAIKKNKNINFATDSLILLRFDRAIENQLINI